MQRLAGTHEVRHLKDCVDVEGTVDQQLHLRIDSFHPARRPRILAGPAPERRQCPRIRRWPVPKNRTRRSALEDMETVEEIDIGRDGQQTERGGYGHQHRGILAVAARFPGHDAQLCHHRHRRHQEEDLLHLGSDRQRAEHEDHDHRRHQETDGHDHGQVARDSGLLPVGAADNGADEDHGQRRRHQAQARDWREDEVRQLQVGDNQDNTEQKADQGRRDDAAQRIHDRRAA
ncbi:hypothetical protein SDC9_162320 [bioreactor metagenome]|uniref:Uncharacterized protein n=1 Tax=bioreactor metagenome TaxID=1076179 RepID=A0A645FKS2_9ZZZZ